MSMEEYMMEFKLYMVMCVSSKLISGKDMNQALNECLDTLVQMHLERIKMILDQSKKLDTKHLIPIYKKKESPIRKLYNKIKCFFFK